MSEHVLDLQVDYVIPNMAQCRQTLLSGLVQLYKATSIVSKMHSIPVKQRDR